jgi:hypothetical protein
MRYRGVTATQSSHTVQLLTPFPKTWKSIRYCGDKISTVDRKLPRTCALQLISNNSFLDWAVGFEPLACKFYAGLGVVSFIWLPSWVSVKSCCFNPCFILWVLPAGVIFLVYYVHPTGDQVLASLDYTRSPHQIQGWLGRLLHHLSAMLNPPRHRCLCPH